MKKKQVEKVEPKKPASELIRVIAASKLLNCSEQNVYYMIKKNRLDVIEQYGMKLVRRSDVEAIIASRNMGKTK